MQNRFVIFPKINQADKVIPKTIIHYKWQKRTDLATLLEQEFKGISEFIVLEQPQEANVPEGCCEALSANEIANAIQAGVLLVLLGSLYFTKHAGCTESLSDQMEAAGIEVFTQISAEPAEGQAMRVISSDVLGMIFAYLTIHQITAAARTNKNFSQMTNEKNMAAQNLWKRKFNLHFPEYYEGASVKLNTNWIELFRRTYEEVYAGHSKSMRRLFSIAIEGDMESLRNFRKSKLEALGELGNTQLIPSTNLRYEDLFVTRLNGLDVIAAAAIRSNQDILDYLYATVIADRYDELEDEAHNRYFTMMGKSIIHDAVRCHQPVADILNLITKLSFNIHARYYRSGPTLFHTAVQYGHLELAKALYKFGGGYVNSESRYHGPLTPLMAAAKIGHLPLVEWLLEKGASVDVVINSGTALVYAAKNGHTSVVEKLVAHHANVNIVNEYYKMSPLMVAATNGNQSIAKVLLANNADIAMKNRDGMTALHIAARNGHVAVINEILDLKPTIDTKDITGATELMLAARYGHADVVAALLAYGACANAADNSGETIMAAAKRNKAHAVVKLIQIKLLEEYIEAREKNPQLYRTIVGFFGRRSNSAYTKYQEIVAARNEIMFLKGEMDGVSIEDAKILKQSEVKSILRP